MALTGPDFWSPEKGGVFPTAVGHRCFQFGRRIARDPGWTWAGATGQIFAHMGCAADLMVRLGYDITVWQQRTGLRFRETVK